MCQGHEYPCPGSMRCAPRSRSASLTASAPRRDGVGHSKVLAAQSAACLEPSGGSLQTAAGCIREMRRQYKQQQLLCMQRLARVTGGERLSMSTQRSGFAFTPCCTRVLHCSPDVMCRTVLQLCSAHVRRCLQVRCQIRRALSTTASPPAKPWWTERSTIRNTVAQ